MCSLSSGLPFERYSTGDLANAECRCRALTSPRPIVRSCSPSTHDECDGAVLTHAAFRADARPVLRRRRRADDQRLPHGGIYSTTRRRIARSCARSSACRVSTLALAG